MKALFSWAQLAVGIYPAVGHGQGLHRGVPHYVNHGRKPWPPFPQTPQHRGLVCPHYNRNMEGQQTQARAQHPTTEPISASR
jgi:hypothetical protein